MWFGSLVEFEQLREVCMPLRTLLDYRWCDHPTLSLDEVLPRRLERLILGNIGGEHQVVANGLCAMLLRRSELFPELRRIELRRISDQDGEDPGEKRGFNWISNPGDLD